MKKIMDMNDGMMKIVECVAEMQDSFTPNAVVMMLIDRAISICVFCSPDLEEARYFLEEAVKLAWKVNVEKENAV